MYFFSGEATCRKVMPACAVMSTKRTSTPSVEDEPIMMAANTAAARAKVLGKRPPRKLSGRGLTSLLLFQSPVDFELAFAFGCAPGGDVGATQLIMNVRPVWGEPRGCFQMIDRLCCVALL